MQRESFGVVHVRIVLVFPLSLPLVFVFLQLSRRRWARARACVRAIDAGRFCLACPWMRECACVYYTNTVIHTVVTTVSSHSRTSRLDDSAGL